MSLVVRKECLWSFWASHCHQVWREPLSQRLLLPGYQGVLLFRSCSLHTHRRYLKNLEPPQGGRKRSLWRCFLEVLEDHRGHFPFPQRHLLDTVPNTCNWRRVSINQGILARTDWSPETFISQPHTPFQGWLAEN